jgi:hypothetical protein
MINRKARTAVDKAMHLLVIELNLGKHMLEHAVAHSVSERRTITNLKWWLRDYRRSGSTTMPIMSNANNFWQFPRPGTVIHLLPNRLKGGGPKDNLDNASSEQKGRVPDSSAENSVEDVSKNENIMPQETIGKQIQKIQDKADIISKLQRELKQDIQVFKLNHPKDRGSNSDMVNT